MLKILKKSTYENLLSQIKMLKRIVHEKDSHIDSLKKKYKGSPVRDRKTGRYIKAK